MGIRSKSRVIMLSEALTFGFLVLKTQALDCSSSTEKFTLRDTTDNIGWTTPEETDFSDTSFSFLLKSAVAYAFHVENPSMNLDTEDVVITNATARINGCIQVADQTRANIQKALSNSQEKVYEILGYDQDELTFEGVAKVYEYVEPPAFEPWLIPYIITWIIIIIAGAVMLWPSKDEDEEKDDIKSVIVEKMSVHSKTVNENPAFAD